MHSQRGVSSTVSTGLSTNPQANFADISRVCGKLSTLSTGYPQHSSTCGRLWKALWITRIGAKRMIVQANGMNKYARSRMFGRKSLLQLVISGTVTHMGETFSEKRKSESPKKEIGPAFLQTRKRISAPCSSRPRRSSRNRHRRRCSTRPCRYCRCGCRGSRTTGPRARR